MTVEERLAAELRQRAEAAPVRQDPYGRVSHRIAVSRRRRLGAVVICAVMLLVAGVLGGPSLLGLARHGDGIVDQKKDLGGVPGSPMTWPTRGSLAKDEAYVNRAEGWVAERWNDANPVAKVSAVHVLYAGDVGGQRLVIGAVQSKQSTIGGGEPLVHITALTGPEGSEQRLTRKRFATGQIFTDPAGLCAVALTGAGRAATLVTLVGSDVDELEYSVAPIIGADGTVTRQWTPAVDQDDEPGVVTNAVDLGETGGGVLRVRAMRQGTVVQDSILWTFDLNAAPSERIRQLAAGAEGTQPVNRLAEALTQLEGMGVGRDEITSVRIPWRFSEGEDKTWVALEIGLAHGGELEAVYRLLPKDNTGDYASPEAVRMVPAGQGGKEPFGWRSLGDGGPCDDVHGYVPPGFPEVAEADVVVDGKASKRTEVTGERFVVGGVCSPRAVIEEAAPDDTTVRLYDGQGRVVWSGRVAAAFGGPRTVLDIPLTTGQRN